VCVCVRLCALDSVVRKKCIVGSMSTHLVLNYSSCQRPCPPSLWKPLTKTFNPSLRIHLFILSSTLTSFSSSHWLIISSLIRSFTPLLLLPVFLSSQIFPSVFLLLPLFSISVFLIIPELLLTCPLLFPPFLFLSQSFCMLTFSLLFPPSC